MSEFDIDISGMADLKEALGDLEDDFTTDAVWVTGSNVEYGVYLEFGTEDMPPYPWFRPAIREFQADPEGFLRDNTDFDSIDQIETADEMVATVAAALQNKMENNVNAQKAVDRSPGTHPEHPRRQSGNLTASIQAVQVR